MSMTYAQWVTAVAGYLPANIGNLASETPFVTGSRYNAVVDRAIEYAELRLYRDPDLDFLATRAADGSAYSACLTTSRAVPIASSMIVVESCNLITPASTLPNAPGATRTPLLPASIEFINMVWPSIAAPGPPQHFARTDNSNIIVGPAPDQTYKIEFYGTTRPTPLSYTNTSTYLTQYLPDLFLAATMIFFAGYQKKFGSITASAPEAYTWETYFEAQKKGAAVEEARKKFQSVGWAAEAPTPVATPPRG